MPHFPIKTVDVTNCAEYLCCIRSTVDMDINEVTLRRKNCLFKRRQRRPYAQLSHVDLHDCLCGMCVTVSSDLAPARIGRAGDVCGGISSGCFCDHEKMEKLHGELQHRMVGRGSFAQVKQLDYMMRLMEELTIKVPLALDGAGVEYPPSQARIDAVFRALLMTRGGGW